MSAVDTAHTSARFNGAVARTRRSELPTGVMHGRLPASMEPSRERDGVSRYRACRNARRDASMEPSRERDGVFERWLMEMRERELQWSRRANATE